MAGINLEGDHLRESPEWAVDVLRPTPIKWVRIHTLPTRSLDQKGPNGTSYLEGIEHVCRSGLNIVTPIDVGYTDVVGTIPRAGLDTFVEESYDHSFRAAKLIAEAASRNHVEVVFGIENEIDIKSWIMQSLPGIGWRESSETWTSLSLDYTLKYKRLNNILRGVKDAAPVSRTMANVSAEDVDDLVGLLRTRPRALPVKKSSLESLAEKFVDWKVELTHIKEHLDVDLIGIDTYPNYFLKYPIMGQDTASKVADAAALSGKPVINSEFGYSTYRSMFERMYLELFRRRSARRMQEEFFRNTLSSIRDSRSIGTFPWILLTHTDRAEIPKQETYFGLFQMQGTRVRRMPAFDYYVDWLKRRDAE